MNETKLIKPAPGRKVRRPDHPFAPLSEDEGTLVNWTSYWERALTEGDIVLVDEPAEAPVSEPKTKRNGAGGDN